MFSKILAAIHLTSSTCCVCPRSGFVTVAPVAGSTTAGCGTFRYSNHMTVQRLSPALTV